MQAEDPLSAYLEERDIKYDEEVEKVAEEIYAFAPDEPPIDFCVMVTDNVDFTESVNERMKEIHPGFYILRYIGYGLTAIYVFWGSKETVLAKLRAIVKAEADALASLKASWKNPARLTMPIAFKIGPYELGAFDPNLGIEMGGITYYRDGFLGGLGFPGHVTVRRRDGKIHGIWEAIHVKVNQENEIYDEVKLDEDADVCALTARLAANWLDTQ